MGIYRGRLDIIADILSVASRDAKKTQIMYQANLSYRVLQRYLDVVAGSHLICFDDSKRCYSLTIKGREFLAAYQKYSKTNKHVKKKLSDVANKRKTLEKLALS